MFLLLFIFAGTSFSQVDDGDKHQIAVRFIAPNYISPLENIPAPLEGGEYFGAGLAFEYQRRFAPNFLLGFPLRISHADKLDNESLAMATTVDETRDLSGLGVIGLDALLVFEPIARRSVFDPQIFVGIGTFTEDFSSFTPELPVGVNLNFRMGDNAYLSPQIAYHLALTDTEILDNLQAGIGLHFQLGESTPKPPPPPPVVDTDGDGIPDASDRCPTVPGPAETLGCPDTDGDGIVDIDDKCPEVAGSTAFMGCPDTDNDGIADPDDECPEEAGPVTNNGCPLSDRDGDGISDADDECPDVAGLASLGGCPDSDNDGIADQEDDCPTAAGSAANRGCPDSDNDGVVDKDDACPNEAGPASNRGCPEITVEDREVIEFAIQNINFETSSATLTSESRSVLNQVEDILRRYPGYNLVIGGHTDSVGSAENNQRLSERRAEAVYNYLVDKGIPTRRMSHEGFGETMPIADNRYKDGRDQNRRVTLDLVIL